MASDPPQRMLKHRVYTSSLAFTQHGDIPGVPVKSPIVKWGKLTFAFDSSLIKNY
jgi:hypothetical protein